jgi:hypothetical protein
MYLKSCWKYSEKAITLRFQENSPEKCSVFSLSDGRQRSSELENAGETYSQSKQTAAPLEQSQPGPPIGQASLPSCLDRSRLNIS